MLSEKLRSINSLFSETAGLYHRFNVSLGLPDSVSDILYAVYKLKLNHGDLKASQGDTGHAQIDMITQIYAHILDEDRKIHAQKFEAAFYANPDLRAVRAQRHQGNLRPPH